MAFGDKLVKEVLDDWRSAPIDERPRATLGFLEKLTLTPGDLRPEDLAALRAAGASDQTVLEALKDASSSRDR